MAACSQVLPGHDFTVDLDREVDGGNDIGAQVVNDMFQWRHARGGHLFNGKRVQCCTHARNTKSRVSFAYPSSGSDTMPLTRYSPSLEKSCVVVIFGTKQKAQWTVLDVHRFHQRAVDQQRE